MDLSHIISVLDLLKKGYTKVQDLHNGPLIVPKNSMAIFRRKDDTGNEYLMIVYSNEDETIEIIDERKLNKTCYENDSEYKILELQNEINKLKASVP